MFDDFGDRLLSWVGVLVRSFAYVTLALPVIVVMGASLTNGNSLRFPPEGLSLRWYGQAFQSKPFIDALWTSTKIALIATAISLAIGGAAAFALDRYQFRGRTAFQALVLSPLVVPTVVLGLGLLQFFAWVGIGQTLLGLLAGHVLITLPYVVRVLSASLTLFNRTLEEVAMSLRASPLVVLRRVTMPLLMPAIMSAAVFAFVTSFGNVTLSVFLGFASATTLPVQIFTYIEHNYDPILAAVSTIVILVTLGVILAVERLVGTDRIV